MLARAAPTQPIIQTLLDQTPAVFTTCAEGGSYCIDVDAYRMPVSTILFFPLRLPAFSTLC